MTTHLGSIHIHRWEPFSKKTALRIAKKTPRNPPPIPTWRQLWRTN